ncbi:Acyl carrier protein 2, mitochondrial [Trebouxia sp. C0010 RCD-2024]
MALARALTAIRTGVLSHLRVPANFSATQHQAGPASWQCVRGFAGTYLDKNEVTERILNVVKNFEKVDQSKVTPSAHFQKDLGLDSLDTVELVMAFEEEFAVEIPDVEADKILSTSEAIQYIAAHPQAK